ncbi:MAG: GNAT family N-acetyltransferase [Candidatus Binataceae bacterium]
MHHPEHDRLRQELVAWYRAPAPSIGCYIERRRFGFYRRSTADPDSARLIVDGAAPSDAAAMLADAALYFGDCEINIWIDDHATDAVLGPELVNAGCVRGHPTIFLAHAGPIPHVSPRADVSIEEVTATTLSEFVNVKVKGFENSEDEPPAHRIAEETAVRTAESNGGARYFIARVGGEPAAILGYYDGDHRLIFNLATRVPMRRRGLARILLCGAIADASDRGCRSMMINTDPDDTPINWYRRLGFDDEIYWIRSYTYRRAS